MTIQSLLIVEDDDALVELLKASLAPEQFNVSCIRTIDDAIETCKKQDFDHYIVDLCLGKELAVPLLELIRTKPVQGKLILHTSVQLERVFEKIPSDLYDTAIFKDSESISSIIKLLG